MTHRKYTITIHTSRKNKVMTTITGVPYASMPAGKPGDNIRFLKQTIVIEASRSISFADSAILENRANSLHTQIEKSLLYLYSRNGQRIYISRI